MAFRIASSNFFFFCSAIFRINETNILFRHPAKDTMAPKSKEAVASDSESSRSNSPEVAEKAEVSSSSESENSSNESDSDNDSVASETQGKKK